MASISKETKPQDLFDLLESNNLKTIDEIQKLIVNSLNEDREPWLLSNLVDYCYLSESSKARDIVASIREPNDKNLIEKLDEGLKYAETRLASLRLILYISTRQPQPCWLYKLVDLPIFSRLLSLLQTDTDICILVPAILVLTIYLPIQPAKIGKKFLQNIFRSFSHLLDVCLQKNGSVTEVFLLHLHTAVYSLFHRLYSMYPCNFLHYLRQYYTESEHCHAYEAGIIPMLERVRFHPRLVTDSSHSETDSMRWLKMEVQDIVVECARLSLDVIEGSGESVQYPTVTSKLNPFIRSRYSIKHIPPIDSADCMTIDWSPPEKIPVCDDPAGMWSPSVVCGLSTPPPIKATTSQLTSELDASSSTHHAAVTSTFTSTPVISPPANTPCDTPVDEIFDKSLGGRSHNQGSKHNSGSSTTSHRVISLSNTPAIETYSVPPSPLKPCFTSDPPANVQRTAVAQELNFICISDYSCEKGLSSKEVSFKETDSRSQFGEASFKECTDFNTDEHYTIINVNEKQGHNHCYVDNCHMLDDFIDSHDNDLVDEEVSDLTKGQFEVPPDSPSTKLNREETAASVKQFMKRVNRIRFNSLTVNQCEYLVPLGQVGLHKRVSSCPHLDVLISEKEEDQMDQDAIRSTSLITHEELCPSKSVPLAPNNLAHSENSIAHDFFPDSASQSPRKDTVLQDAKDSSHDSSGTMSDIVKESTLPAYLHSALQSTLPAGSVSQCPKCQLLFPHTAQDQTTIDPGCEVSLFKSLSPPELLDLHLHVGNDVHTKELSRLPMTAGQEISWTHFGGLPPVDEINILRSQLKLLQNQLMYERHKREQHAQRNRRLLHKITQAKTVEESNSAISHQLKIQENEIHNLQVSLKLLHEQQEQMYIERENSEYEKTIRIQKQRIEALEFSQNELQTVIINQKNENNFLKKSLKLSEFEKFNCQKEMENLREKAAVVGKLREQVTCLNKELLLKGELQQRYQECIARKLEYQSWPDNEYLIKSLRQDISNLKKKLNQKHSHVESEHAKLIEYEDLFRKKEQAVSSLKKKLELCQNSYHDEILAVEAKCNSLMKVNQQLECFILELHSRLDNPLDKLSRSLSTPHPPDAVTNASSPMLSRSHSDSPDTARMSMYPVMSSISDPIIDHLRNTMEDEANSHVYDAGSTDDIRTSADSAAVDSAISSRANTGTLSDSGSIMY